MSKLHPVYVALDNYQYNRAIKLASALPDSNVLGKALLAHAYYKSGQRYQSLVTLYKILTGLAGSEEFFCELKLDVENALEAFEEREQQANKQVTVEPAPSAASKKGKKGKKKPATTTNSPAAAATSANEAVGAGLDLLDILLTKPTLTENWDSLPLSSSAITDETTLGTMSVTLNGLKLPLTAYQIYSWGISNKEGATEVNLRKTFSLGLAVLAAPSKWTTACQEKITAHVLSHIQMVALQWARTYANQPGGLTTFYPMLATAWAAQSVLWQLQWLPEDDKRSMILPRLAESMAQKLLQQEDGISKSAEIQLLAVRVLEHQSKWEEMLEILKEPSSDESDGQSSPMVVSDFGVAFSRQEILKERARIMMQLDRHDAAKEIYEQLLAKSPDDWSCWKGHLECCTKLDNIPLTKELVGCVLSEQAGEKYPLRGPFLMKVELEAHMVRCNPSGSALKALSSSIQEYGNMFASRAVCAFSDLELYLELVLATVVDDAIQIVEDLLKYAKDMRVANSAPSENDSCTNKERQCRLRAFIFAVKFNHKILAKYVDLQDLWLPDWVELVKEWKATLSMSSSNEGEESQKEVKPGDDLALLAVQQLLYKNQGDVGCQVVGLALLELAIDHSPDNAYLKILAIYVYYLLDSVEIAYAIYQTMGIKHIQLDSCTFIILPYLLEGGFYNEAIEVCNALLRFQAGTARDCGDYAGRAMEGGTITKANEFLVFQRKKISASLAVLDAKGKILDCAVLFGTIVPGRKNDEFPIMQGALGALQGIVGGDEDMARAAQMVEEVHNPYAAMNVVSWVDHGGSVADCIDMADNRDLSILCNQILLQTPPPSREEIARDALRRGHIHGMLIRATLCLDAAKGPKKGKIVKPTEQLDRRTKSLLDSVSGLEAFMSQQPVSATNTDGSRALLTTALQLCRVLAVINAGMPLANDDSLEDREQRAYDLLNTQALSQLKLAEEVLTFSVKSTASLLPNFVVPLFAVFRMCANICDLYGWGKRKFKSKRPAEALKEVAAIFSRLISKMLASLSSLPATDELRGDELNISVPSELQSLVGDQAVSGALDAVAQARYRTRLRIEPILQQMNEYLDSFDVKDD